MRRWGGGGVEVGDEYRLQYKRGTPFTNMDKYMSSKLWIEICLSMSKFQRLHNWSWEMDKLFHPTFYNVVNYPPMD